MSLRFNTFRAQRYLRSKFVEGKYLLASEASDIELEILDVLRKVVKETIGDVALEEAWKVEKLSSTELLVKPGEAWFKGLPFQMRSGKDQLVSGAVLSAGITPVGITISDDSSGLGKVILFNDGSTTPTNLYRVVITAKEELITEVEDQFLQNANLTESTAQKIRLNFQINLVPNSLQTESPVPYRDENSASLIATNFPSTGAFASPNLVNQIVVTPTAAGNGELITTNLVSGSERIDGRDLELILRNDSSIGGGHPIPKSPTEAAAFENGKLIDSRGNVYHVNAIFNDVVSTQVVIRIDKEPDQTNPEIINTFPFTLVKRDVFATDSSSGLPQGKLFWNIATANWHSTNLFVHESKVVDLRTSVSTLEDYELFTNNKHGLRLTGGGTVAWSLSTQKVSWTSTLTLVNPHGTDQTIATASVPLVEGGSLAYDLDLVTGGAIQKGTLAINVTAFGATSTLSAVNLSQVLIGNIAVDSAGTVGRITAVDDINNTITTTPAFTANGAGFIYYDSFGPSTVPLTKEKYILAVRKSNIAYIGGLELEDGENQEIGDIISWKHPVANFAALPLTGNINGDVRLVLDTRLAYTWHSASSLWKFVFGISDGIEVQGGGIFTWTAPNLTFNADMYLEIPGLAYTDNTIAFSTQSPIALASSLSVAYVIPNLVTGGPSLTVTVGALSTVPANAVIIARRDSSGNAYVAAPVVTVTEQSYLVGVTSSIQTQLNNKASIALDNLVSTAVNADISPGTDNSIKLGSSTKNWTQINAKALNSSTDISISANAGANKIDEVASKHRISTDGTNFMEVQYYDSLTLTANIAVATEISSTLSFTSASFSGVDIDYVIKEATSNKVRKGRMEIANDGTTPSLADGFTESGGVVGGSGQGIIMSADISGGNVRILYRNTSVTNAATMRCTKVSFR